MSIKGIIFDFDGTLFDSMGIWETAGSDYLSSIGHIAQKDLSKKLETMSLLESAEYLKVQYGLPMSKEEIVRGINQTVADFYLHRAMPKENVIPVLMALQKKGIKMCIATATDRDQIEAALKRCDMRGYFESIFTCSEVGYSKENPKIYEYACDFLKTAKSETAVFEDACYAAKTAKDAGFFVVGIFDRFEKKAEEIQKISDIYIRSFSETDKLLTI